MKRTTPPRVTVLAAVVALAIPAAAAAEPGVTTGTQRLPAAGVTFANDPSGSGLPTTTQYVVTNNGWAVGFTETAGSGTLGGVLNYKVLPPEYRVGMTADQVYMPPTTGRFVQVTGAENDSRRRESYYWVADNGVRFGLDTSNTEQGQVTLSALNLHYPVPAPWVVLSLFAPGATLSRQDALIRHDGVPANPVVAGIDQKEVK